jgi:protein-disulfide isomerase
MPWRTFAQRARVPDLERFALCMEDPVVAALVAEDRAAADRLGARGTPTVLVDGVRFTGTLPQSVVDSLVENALQKRKAPF